MKKDKWEGKPLKTLKDLADERDWDILFSTRGKVVQGYKTSLNMRLFTINLINIKLKEGERVTNLDLYSAKLPTYEEFIEEIEVFRNIVDEILSRSNAESIQKINQMVAQYNELIDQAKFEEAVEFTDQFDDIIGSTYMVG